MAHTYEVLYYTKYTHAELLYVEADSDYMPNILDEALSTLEETYGSSNIFIVSINKV